MSLAKAVYAVTNGMPESERFGLTSQMRRSAVSIPSNIAEGFGREGKPEILRFLRIARGSLFELQTQLELANALGFLRPDEPTNSLSAETDRVLQALIRGLERSPPRLAANRGPRLEGAIDSPTS